MPGRLRIKNTEQKSRGASAWTLREAVVVRVWEVYWFVFLRWTPKKLNRLRLFSLRIFGARIFGRPFVFSSARIYAPFNLELHDHSCIGPNAFIYNLGEVVLNENCVISQDAVLCGGTHDLSTLRLPLLVGDIEIEREAFVGMRAMILPGLTVGAGAVVGAGAIVTKDVEPFAVVGGNPAKVIKKRVLRDN